MKKINPIAALLYIVLFPILINTNISAAEQQDNIISSSDKLIHLQYWQIAKDPSPDDSLKHLPDSLWQLFNPFSDNEIYLEGNWLIRTNIVIEETVNKETILGLFPGSLITAYEIYWDGKKIAQNGNIGIEEQDEEAGLLNYNLVLPPHLVSAEKHTIVVRISNHNNYSPWKWYYGNVSIGPYSDNLNNIFSSNYSSMLTIGILIIPFLFNLFLYITRKRKPEHLLFSLICFSLILDFATEQLPFFFDIPTTYIHWTIYAYQTTTILFSLLFPAFFIYMFSFSKKYILFITVLNLAVFIFYTNFWDMFHIMAAVVLVESSIIALWALRKRLEEGIIILIGIIIAWIAFYFNFDLIGLATTMVLATSFSIARKFARKEKTEYEARLKSARLENELLKKNINPHFLFNTLTSIIVWLRKDPQSAIKLIETLAEEFRMVMQISSLKEIPIRQEIDLCKTHLKIMSYRKGADYKLETIGIVEEENVPPVIFHTLVENGLTHGYENKTRGTFTLERKKHLDSVEYILSNDGDFSNNGSKKSSGFGANYIKSRLEESYPDRWEFISCKNENGWETKIKIKDQ